MVGPIISRLNFNTFLMICGRKSSLCGFATTAAGMSAGRSLARAEIAIAMSVLPWVILPWPRQETRCAIARATFSPVSRRWSARRRPHRTRIGTSGLRTLCRSRFRSAMSRNEINVPKLEMKRQVSLWRHRPSVQRHRKSRHSPCDTAMGVVRTM